MKTSLFSPRVKLHPKDKDKTQTFQFFTGKTHILVNEIKKQKQLFKQFGPPTKNDFQML